MGNKALPWSGLRDAKPKQGEESGVGGDCEPSDLVFLECRGRKIEGTERAQPLGVFFLFLFPLSIKFVYVLEVQKCMQH